MIAPQGWTTRRLGEVLTLINGRAYKKIELLDKGTPVLRIQNLNGGDRWYYSDLDLPASKYCEAGDLLFAWSATFGPYIWQGPKSIYHYHIWKIELGPELDKPFAYHLLQNITGSVKAAGRGISMTHMTKEGMEDWEVALPPLEEQKRIAGILDQAAEICRLRTSALDKLNTLGQAIFHEMFGSGSFERVALAEVIEARSSLADPILPENAQLPHVGPEHIRQGGAEIEWDRVVSCAQDGVTSGKYRFEPNDIIYSKIRPYLNKVAIADRVGMCSADMYALVANSDVVKNSYLHFILGSSDFLSYAASVSGRANIPKMNRKQLMAYEIPVAPLDMQAEFEGKISSIRGQAAKLSKSLSTGEKLFASLQHRAFRGEL